MIKRIYQVLIFSPLVLSLFILAALAAWVWVLTIFITPIYFIIYGDLNCFNKFGLLAANFIAYLFFKVLLIEETL